jgi:hypothetical protein
MKPPLFVGSSKESLYIAYAVQENLESVAEVTVWDQGIFSLSQTAISSLIKTLDISKFGVFILSPDDITKIRGKEYPTARDNLIFELGLFIGKIGHERTFFIIPSDSKDIHLPSDLLGLMPAYFDANRKDGNFRAALGPACNQIRQVVISLEAPRFNSEVYLKFNQIHRRAREILISAIINSENADKFPHITELNQEPIFSLSKMAGASGIKEPSLFILGLNAIGGLISKSGDKAQPWENMQIEKDLVELDKILTDWKKASRRKSERNSNLKDPENTQFRL